ncbi:MAG: nucleotidyltransferase family protein [Gammaproteobacteria bacterium]|nr:nucleotidyltransferase family protein [Gammaproteobacteria bacterium]
MRALLLAAGLGTRLRPITNSVPKCLVKINGRPLLDYWIELLSVGGIVDILINLHYMPEAVRSYIKRCPYPVNITTVYEERLLGTGGTLLKNRDFFRNEPSVLVHADNLSSFDVRAFIRQYQDRDKGIEMTMMTFDTTEPESCGIVELDDRGIVTAFHEKVKNPPGNLANGAVYILSPSIIDFLVGYGRELIDFSTEVLPSFMGRINTFHNRIYHRDIGTVENLLAAQNEYPTAVARQRRAGTGGLSR